MVLARKLGQHIHKVRVGISPVSLVLGLLGRDHLPRFKGVKLVAPNNRATWSLANAVWAGEYDLPGFVPEPGWRVLDIGANFGAFAMLAASRGARVTAYEPHPETFRALVANTARWDVDCRNEAVTLDQSGEAELYVHADRPSRNTLSGVDLVAGEPLSSTLTIRAVPLSEALAEPYDLVKVDCEGTEFELFQASPDLLRNAARMIG